MRSGTGLEVESLVLDLLFSAAAGVSFTSASIVVIKVTVGYDHKQISASRTEHRQLPLNYDPAAFAAFWDQHVCIQLAHVVTTTVRVVSFLLHSVWLYYHPVSNSRQISESEPHATWGANWGVELHVKTMMNGRANETFATLDSGEQKITSMGPDVPIPWAGVDFTGKVA